MKICGQARTIPRLGKLPDLLNRENFSALEIVALAPLVDPFFRPEEQHGRSGEDQVIVPVRERNWKMDKEFAICHLTVFNF